MTGKIVCSTTHLYHYLINPSMDDVNSFLENGIRPLSDFPESERWQELEREMLGFYKNLYNQIARPVLLRPYPNSGIFVTPIDFRALPGTYLYEKPRFTIPYDRLDPSWVVVTYVLDDERLSFPFDPETMALAAAVWDDAMVRNWFAKDPTKMFFYVPQAAVYQGRIEVSIDDYDSE